MHLELHHLAEEAHLRPRPVLSFRIEEHLEQYAIHEILPFRVFQPLGIFHEALNKGGGRVRTSASRLVDVPSDDEEYVWRAGGSLIAIEGPERGLLIVPCEDLQTANHGMSWLAFPYDE